MHVSLPFGLVSGDDRQTIINVPSSNVTPEQVEAFDKALEMFTFLKQRDKELLFKIAQRMEVRAVVSEFAKVVGTTNDNDNDVIDETLEEFDDYNFDDDGEFVE